MGNIRKFWILGIVFGVAQIGALGETKFELPDGTPGLMPGGDANVSNCVYVHIRYTNCDLYFPTDGHQPSTSEAGMWSGARYVGQANDDAVTDWWVRVFGGDRAVALASSPVRLIPGRDEALPMRFDTGSLAAHIIQVNTEGAPENFEQQFWQAFREIARDPVGRVLLYRLLIEIRRTNDEGGCWGEDVDCPEFLIFTRNFCRHIEIKYNPNNLAFDSIENAIFFKYDDTPKSMALIFEEGVLNIKSTPRPTDVGLFHEMLHWFHELRHPDKKLDNVNDKPQSFSYAARCYYGVWLNTNPSRIGNTVWSSIRSDWMDGEEIATILGCPDPNNPKSHILDKQELMGENTFLPVAQEGSSSVTIGSTTTYILNNYKFLNGEDLSENAYRASKGLPMRWGHVVDDIVIPAKEWPGLPNYFRLAHHVAEDCFQAITGRPPIGWCLVQMQSVEGTPPTSDSKCTLQ